MANKGRLKAFAAVACWGAFVGSVQAAEIEDAQELFRTGKYAECAALAAAEIDRGSWDEQWPYLKVQAELAEGKYARALETLEAGARLNGRSLRLRYLARSVYLHNGKSERAAAALERLERYVTADPRRYGEPADRVALGHFLLERGADPRQVLELVYDELRKSSPEFVDTYFATAKLALDKYDNALAAETLRAAPRAAQKDPQYHYLLARAYAPDDPLRTEAALKAALDVNPRHVDSLLLRVDRLIDAEEYGKAEDTLKQVLAVNANHPSAWAYKAVLAHLANDAAAERQAREQALAHWSTNPEVDHLIGRKLSEKYRFAEGRRVSAQSTGVRCRLSSGQVATLARPVAVG